MRPTHSCGTGRRQQRGPSVVSHSSVDARAHPSTHHLEMTKLMSWRGACRVVEPKGSQPWSILESKTFTLHLALLSPSLPFLFLSFQATSLTFLLSIKSDILPHLKPTVIWCPALALLKIMDPFLGFPPVFLRQTWPPVVSINCQWGLMGGEWGGTALVFADLLDCEISLHLHATHLHLNRFK